MTFGRRLRLYFFGFLIGLLILTMILKGKQCSSPGDIKLEELLKQKIELSEKAQCKLGCIKWDVGKFKSEFLSKGKVNYSLSDIHAHPWGKYFLDAKKDMVLPFRVVVVDADTISKIDDIQLMGTSCNCP